MKGKATVGLKCTGNSVIPTFLPSLRLPPHIRCCCCLRLFYTPCHDHHHLLPGSSVPYRRRWWKKEIYLMQKCRNCYIPLPAVRLTGCPNPHCFCLCLLKNNSYRRCLLLYHTPVRHHNASSFRYQYRCRR